MFRFVILALAVAAAQAGGIAGGLIASPVIGSPLGVRALSYGGVAAPLTTSYGALGHSGIVSSPYGLGYSGLNSGLGYSGLGHSGLGYSGLSYAAPVATSYSNLHTPYVRSGYAAAPLGLGYGGYNTLGYGGYGSLGYGLH